MHAWNLCPADAIRLQKEFSPRLAIQGMPERITTVAGVDCAFSRAENTGFCAIVLFSFPGLDVLEERFFKSGVDFPYIPGLLSFREGPLVMGALALLSRTPDVLVFDGQGIAHPRRFGIASHLGLVCGIPSIGCAKSRLYGSYDEPGPDAGSRSPLLADDGERIGAVVRTRSRVKPVFVSPGHLFGVNEAADFMMRCVRTYRVPLPTRIADIRVAEYKQSCLS